MPCSKRVKGGPSARLSFFLGLLCWFGQPSARDLLEDAFDADYRRQLIPGPEAPHPAIGALPGFDGTAPCAGADSAWHGASVSAGDRYLIRRRARFGFAHRNTDAAFAFALGAAPGVELRFAADRSRRALFLGDTAQSVAAGGADWGVRAAIEFPLTPLFVPAVVVGARSSSPGADELEALSFRGSTPIGLAWSFAWGRRHRDFPIRLKMPSYAPLAFPFLFRQDFREAGLALTRGPWQAAWSGRWTEARPPATRPMGYSLDDSAQAWRQEARGAYSRNGFTAALDFDVGMGRHVFQARTRKGDRQRLFSWQRGRQADYAARADLACARRRASLGLWLAAGETEYDALHPEIPFGHYVWDRNGVIDSYQGSLLGVFSEETWLLHGAAYAGHAGLGMWWRSAWAGFAYRFSAGYQYLILQANSHLTRRRTAFLLGYTESSRDRIYPTVEADLLPAGLELERALDNFRVTIGGQAALPLRVRIDRGGDSGKSGARGGGGGPADYAGGTVAGIRLGYRLP